MPWEEIGAKNHIVQEAQFREGEDISQLEEGDIEAEKDQARASPTTVTSMVNPFKEEGRKASKVGETINQFKSLPPVIAPSPRRNIGASIL